MATTMLLYFVVQGGTLIEYEGRQRLLEIAQVPKENVSCILKKHQYYSHTTPGVIVSLTTTWLIKHEVVFHMHSKQKSKASFFDYAMVNVMKVVSYSNVLTTVLFSFIRQWLGMIA